MGRKRCKAQVTALAQLVAQQVVDTTSCYNLKESEIQSDRVFLGLSLGVNMFVKYMSVFILGQFSTIQ